MLFKANLLAVDDVVLQSLFNRGAFGSLLAALRLDAFEQFREFRERIVSADIAFKLALVINQLTRDCQLSLADPV